MLLKFGAIQSWFGRSWVLFSLSGLCLALITLPLGFLWVLPGLVFFLYAVTRSRGKFETWLGGWLVGIMKAAGSLGWLWTTYPLEWVHFSEPATQLTFIGLFWFSCALFLGGGIGLVALGVRFACDRYGQLSLIFFPVLWLLGELIGSFLLSLVLLGSGSYLNAYLTYGFIGLAIGRLDVFYSSAFLGGIYGLTLTTALLGVLVFASLKSYRYALWVSVLFIFMSAATSFYLIKFHEVSMPEKKVVVVETAFTTLALAGEDGHQNKRQEVIDAVKEALKFDSDIILLPEDSRFTTSFPSPEIALGFLNIWADGKPVLVVDSSRIESPNNVSAVVREFYFDLDKNKVWSADKQFLAPQGEYPTYLFEKILKWTGNSESLKFISRNQNYVVGPLSFDSVPPTLPTTLFCYESASGVGVKKLSGYGGGVVLHPISHGRFHSPRSMWYQLDTMLRVQAIWNGVAIISAGNMSTSLIYLPSGKIIGGNALMAKDRWKLIEFETGIR